jgi:hypothetical protein
MTDTTTFIRTSVTMKGSLKACLVVGDAVQLWYSSPTGDSSDSQIHTIQCLSNEQAIAVSKLHRTMWGI